jgi:hypothetical protein
MYDDDPYAFNPDEGSHLYRSPSDEAHDDAINPCWCCRLEEAVLEHMCGRCYRDFQYLKARKSNVPESN